MSALPPPAVHPRRWPTAKLVGLTATAAVIIVMGVIVAYEWYSTTNMWDNLRRAEHRFHPPSNWAPVGRAAMGSAGCVISCDNPRIVLVYRTRESPKQACRDAKTAIERSFGPIGIDRYGLDFGCGPWTAPARRISDRGSIFAGADTAQRLRGNVDWEDRIPIEGDGTYVSVIADSGID